MENRIILKLWSEKNHSEKLELVEELYDYFKDGRSTQAFVYIDSLVIGLLRLYATSSYQVSVMILRILRHIVAAMKMDYKLYVKATFKIGFEELGHKRKEIREVSRDLLVDLISFSSTEPQQYLDRIVNACVKHWDLIWKEQGLEVIRAMQQNKKVDISKYTEALCALVTDRNGRIRTKAVQVLVDISHRIDKEVFCSCALKYKISETKLRKLNRRLQFHTITNKQSNLEEWMRYNSINTDNGERSVVTKRKAVMGSLKTKAKRNDPKGSMSSFSDMQSSKHSSRTASSHPSTATSATSAAFLCRGTSMASSQAQCKDAKNAKLASKEQKPSNHNLDTLKTPPARKSLIKNFRHILSTLKDTDRPWTSQVYTLKEMQCLIQDNRRVFKEGNVNFFLESLEHCIILLLNYVQVRGLFIKEVCSTINCTCEVFQQKASKFGARIVPSLLRLIPTLSKTISNSATTTMRVIIKNSFSSIILIQLHKHGFPSRSYLVRRSCASLLYYSLICNDSKLLSKWSLLVEKLLMQALQDRDHVTRIIGRKSFWKYFELFPPRANNFFKTLNWNGQKHLAAEKIHPTTIKVSAIRRFPSLLRSSHANSHQVLREMTSMLTSRVFETASLWHQESDLCHSKLKENSRSVLATKDPRHFTDSQQSKDDLEYHIDFKQSADLSYSTDLNCSSDLKHATDFNHSTDLNHSTALKHSIRTLYSKIPKESPKSLATKSPGHRKATQLESDAQSHRHTYYQCLFMQPKGRKDCLCQLSHTNLNSLNKIPVDDRLVQLTHTERETTENWAMTCGRSIDVAVQTSLETRDQSLLVTCKDFIHEESIQCKCEKMFFKVNGLREKQPNFSNSISTTCYQEIFFNPQIKQVKNSNLKNCISSNKALTQTKYFSNFFDKENALKIQSQSSLSHLGVCVAVEKKSSNHNNYYLTKITKRRNCSHQKLIIYGRCNNTRRKDHSVLPNQCITIKPASRISQQVSLPSFPINVALRMTSVHRSSVTNCHTNFTLSSYDIQDSFKKNIPLQQMSCSPNKLYKYNQLHNKRHKNDKHSLPTNSQPYIYAHKLKRHTCLTNQEFLPNICKSSFPVETAAKLLFEKTKIPPYIQKNHIFLNLSSFREPNLEMKRSQASKSSSKSLNDFKDSNYIEHKKSSQVFDQISQHSNIDSNQPPKLFSMSAPSVHCFENQRLYKVIVPNRCSFYRSSESSVNTSLPTSTPPTSVLQMTPQDLQLHTSQRFLNLFPFP